MAIEEMEALPGTATIPHQRELLGHPVGLFYLAFTEAWERFSYYGMQTLLVLYMTSQLLKPPHIDRVAFFGPFRRMLEGVYGPLDIIALSSAIFGLYTSLVYLTPIAGGLLADRVLGRRRTITTGALLMAAGHFLMAFDVSFLLALLCLVLGVGCFKGNIASQVGALYPPADNRRADAFQIFYLGINAGVIISPIVCGTLGEKVGWHWGFGAAGVGMLIGLSIYLAGRRYLPSDDLADAEAHKDAPVAAATPMTTRQKTAIVLLILLLPVLAVGSVGNQEIFNAYLLWGQANYDFVFFGWTVPTSYLVTLDAVVSVTFLFLTVVFWRWYGTKWREPDELSKITLGLFISVFGILCLVAGAAHVEGTGGKVSLWYALAFHTINSIGFANIFPVSLALYARAAPPQLSATIIGIYYLFLFGANTLVGWIGGWLDKMPATRFWGIHAGMILAAGVIFLVVKLLFGRMLAPTAQDVTGVPPAV